MLVFSSLFFWVYRKTQEGGASCCEFELKSHTNKLRFVEQKGTCNQYQTNLKQQQQQLQT